MVWLMLVSRRNQAGKGGERQPKTNFLHYLILPKETSDVARGGQEWGPGASSPKREDTCWLAQPKLSLLWRLDFILCQQACTWEMSWDAADFSCLEMIQRQVSQTSSKPLMKKETSSIPKPEWDINPRFIPHLLSRGFLRHPTSLFRVIRLWRQN